MATWLLFSLCPDNTNRLKVFWVKISLAVLSCGKLMDKLRYIFSQLTDSNGQLIFQRWVKETCICDIQGVQKKLCFFTIHCNPYLAYIAVRDPQSSQRRASVQSLLLAGNFLYNQ